MTVLPGGTVFLVAVIPGVISVSGKVLLVDVVWVVAAGVAEVV